MEWRSGRSSKYSRPLQGGTLLLFGSQGLPSGGDRAHLGGCQGLWHSGLRHRHRQLPSQLLAARPPQAPVGLEILPVGVSVPAAVSAPSAGVAAGVLCMALSRRRPRAAMVALAGTVNGRRGGPRMYSKLSAGQTEYVTRAV